MSNATDRFGERTLWVPEWVERENPLDGEDYPDVPVEHLNYDPHETDFASDEELRQERGRFGVLLEPEAAREQEGRPPPPNAQAFGMGYADTYWTHFDFRADVRAAISRMQEKFPNQTFANTYYCHPPVYQRTYEFVSFDSWRGGMVNSRYAGYRGKPIGTDLGNRVFNALFNDQKTPNIAWIIWNGRMWTRGYGWGPSPWGPAGSDAGHFYHVHTTYVL